MLCRASGFCSALATGLLSFASYSDPISCPNFIPFGTLRKRQVHDSGCISCINNRCKLYLAWQLADKYFVEVVANNMTRVFEVCWENCVIPSTKLIAISIFFLSSNPCEVKVQRVSRCGSPDKPLHAIYYVSLGRLKVPTAFHCFH